MIICDAIKRAGSTDPAKILAALKKTDIKASTGQIKFNELGEIIKNVQIQVVKDGNWHHYAVIDDAVLLAPPNK